MSGSNDLLDFFSAPGGGTSNTAANNGITATTNSGSSKSLASFKLAPPPAAVVLPSYDSDELHDYDSERESFDFSSHLRSQRDHEQMNHLGDVGDDDQWNSLRSSDTSVTATTSTSVNAARRIAPDSIQYKLGKELDKFTARFDVAADKAIKSINAFDEKHTDFAKSFNELDEKHKITKRLNEFGDDLTKQADRVSAEAKVIKTKGVKALNEKTTELKKKIKDRKSKNSSNDSTNSTGSRRQTSGQFISIGLDDRIPHPDDYNASGSESDRDGTKEPRRYQSPPSGSPNPAISPIDSFSAFTAAFPSNPSSVSAPPVSSSFSYQPQRKIPMLSPPPASSFALPPPPMAPPANLFQLPSTLRMSEEEEEETSTTSNSHQPPLSLTDTPSSTSHSRENSFNFNSLRFDDVTLSPKQDDPNLFSPDSKNGGGGRLIR